MYQEKLAMIAIILVFTLAIGITIVDEHHMALAKRRIIAVQDVTARIHPSQN
jgi:hypothetical protein